MIHRIDTCATFLPTCLPKRHISVITSQTPTPPPHITSLKMTTEDVDPPIGLPGIAACLVLGWLFLRWYRAPSTPTPTTTRPSATSSRSGTIRRPSERELRALRNKAEVVRGMFPQLSEDAVVWELMKNGGSIETATEAVLRDGRLPEPPEPIVAPPPPPPAAPSRPRQGTEHTDLITRYNLTNRLKEEEPAAEATEEKGKQPAWSQDKAQRAEALRKRKEEMILQARRKLEAMERAKEKGKAVDSSA